MANSREDGGGLFGKYHAETLDRYPALAKSLQYLVMAAAEYAKAMRDPLKKGFFSAETNLQKADRRLKESYISSIVLAHQILGNTTTIPENSLEIALDGFKYKYPYWSDAYSVLDKILKE